MHQFDYQAPLSLAEAIDHLSQGAGSARPLAGGTDLLDQMRLGRLTPDLIVDLKKIPELNVLRCDSDGLHVGAAVPCYRIYGMRDIGADYTALRDACHIIGGIQIQSRATLGGNLCNSGPAADSIPALIALAGQCVVAGPAGTREVPVESFCTAPGRNVLAPGELLVELRFPLPGVGRGSHYRRMIPRHEMDIAVVGVAASLHWNADTQTISAARLALGAVAPTPLWAREASAFLVGKPATAEVFAEAAQQAVQIISPISDMRGTREYRLHATAVLVRRVLETAAARAQGRPDAYRIGD